MKALIITIAMMCYMAISFLLSAQTDSLNTIVTDSTTLEQLEHLLDEVVVKGERPTVRVIDGKLTYDVQQLTKDKVVSNAYESLLQLPGVSEMSGTLNLAGANGLSIIINGKPTTMNYEQLISLLKSMPASRIKTAEVMYSTPPKYQVRGAAINIILGKGDAETQAVQGEVNGAYKQSYYANYSGGVSLLYASEKLAADLLYSAGSNKSQNNDDLSSLHTLNNTVYDIELQNKGISESVNHNIRFGLDYDLDKKNKLGLVYTGALSPSFHREEVSSGNYSNSDTDKDGDDKMHNLDLSYTFASGLRAGVNYTYYDSQSTQNFDETGINNGNGFISDFEQKVDRTKLYIDKSQGLPKNWRLDYGTSFLYAKDRNYQHYNPIGNPELPLVNTNSTLEEYTGNLYAGLGKSFTQQFSMNFSLAGEYYQRDDFDAWSVFPTAEMTYMFSPQKILQFSMSTNKSYPSYWEMQQSVSYFNSYAAVVGNPKLRPYSSYSGQLTYILNSKYLLTAYCSYMPDYAIQMPYQSTQELLLIYSTQNTNFSRTAGVNFAIPFRVKNILDSRATLNGSNQRIKNDHFYDIAFDREKWVGFTRLDNTINISSKPNIKMEVSGFYITPSLQGLYDLSDIWSVDGGAKWIFLDGKAEIRVKGTDLFNSIDPDPTVNYAGQNLKMNLHPDSRKIEFSFSLRFGDYKEKKRKEVDTSRFGQGK